MPVQYPHHDPHSTDDSGISLDDLEGEGYPHSTAGDTNGSVYGGQSASLSPDDHETRGGAPVKLYPAPVRSGYDPRDGYGGPMMGGREMGGRERADGRGGYGGGQQQQQQQQGGMPQRPQQYSMHHQQRLPSIDMGIGAIINRPPGAL
jgi:hypothetical protein